MQQEQKEIYPATDKSFQNENNPPQNKKEALPKYIGISSQKQQKFERYWNIIMQKLIDKKEKQQTISKYKSILLQSQTNPHLDRAIGAVYGAIIGDALGAYCQFCHSLTDAVVDEAMQMPGGGTFGLYPGQFTDDSQMATHLLKGLSKLDINQVLQKQEHRLVCNIALEYINWQYSGPFDIGNTCRLGISSLMDYHHYEQLQGCAKICEKKPAFFDKMFQEIYERNHYSLANGSLMRISPFALFFSMINKDPLQHAQFIRDQIRLTHCNPLIGQAGLFWVNTLTMLINRKDDERQTFKKIFQTNKSLKCFQNLRDWIQEAEKEKSEAMSATSNMGHAKIAFSYGLKALSYIASGLESQLDESFYVRWLRWIIKSAGDTDTNAAIAGGMLGSIIGFWNLPTKYVVKSLKTITDGRPLVIKDEKQQFKPFQKNNYQNPIRQSLYEPANVLFLALDVVQKCRRHHKNSSSG